MTGDQLSVKSPEGLVFRGSTGTYYAPQGVTALAVRGRPVLTTAQGGRVSIDPLVLALWRRAQGRTLDEVLASPGLPGPARNDEIRAALACLAEAGLLQRDGAGSPPASPAPVIRGELVTAVIVGYNSRTWLERCLPSLLAQSYSPLEVIVVDNASTDGTQDWLPRAFPQMLFTRLESPVSFAAAINRGVAQAQGGYLLLLNPDVTLEGDAVAHLVAAAREDPKCAAVAAKLRFTWAPAFLNGLGNRVGAFSWGSDNALGHLDVGQFDDWREVPSACFAAALIPRPAWEAVGAADEGFPMYYEDSEWSYRARLLGYSVRLAPLAVVYHAFSGRVPTGEGVSLPPLKLRRVVYGRLRFAMRLLGRRYLARFLLGYLLEDALSMALDQFSGHAAQAQARLRGWMDYRRSLPSLRQERARIQARRARPDAELFALQRLIPAPLIRSGLPQLTWDIVRTVYLPLLRSGRTRQAPELAWLPAGAGHPTPAGLPSRAGEILRQEGFSALLHRLWRAAQQRLAQP